MKLFAQLFLYLTISLFGISAYAEEAGNTPQDAAFTSAFQAMQAGPVNITLRDQAIFKVPENYGFIPKDKAQELLTAMGNGTADGLEGMIYPLKENAPNWFMVITYDPTGYIKDDDAKDWNADELLDNIKEGTQQQNAERAKMGIPEMEVIGWVQKPLYNSAYHQLVWSISSRDKGKPSSGEDGINYNTYALGREGYFSLNLVTDIGSIEGLKPEAQTLLNALEFNSGKRYTDFNNSTDKVAEYGLAALVGGVAAKKLGFFALIAAFFAKFAKVALIALFAGGAAIRKLFQRKAD